MRQSPFISLYTRYTQTYEQVHTPSPHVTGSSPLLHWHLKIIKKSSSIALTPSTLLQPPAVENSHRQLTSLAKLLRGALLTQFLPLNRHTYTHTKSRNVFKLNFLLSAILCRGKCLSSSNRREFANVTFLFRALPPLRILTNFERYTF